MQTDDTELVRCIWDFCRGLLMYVYADGEVVRRRGLFCSSDRGGLLVDRVKRKKGKGKPEGKKRKKLEAASTGEW